MSWQQVYVKAEREEPEEPDISGGRGNTAKVET